MHRWKLTEPAHWVKARRGAERGLVYVTLPADGRDEWADLAWEGDAHLVEQMSSRLLSSRGYQGHAMEAKTTPLDLSWAMRGPLMELFEPELVEGEIGRRPK